MKRVFKSLRPLFEKHRDVGLVYLFGSHARGEAGRSSDVDIAVYFNQKDPVKRHNLLFQIAGDVSQSLKTDNVDIVSLNDLESPLLKFRIIKEGNILFEKEPFRVLVEPKILNDYFDFADGLRRYGLSGVAA